MSDRLLEREAELGVLAAVVERLGEGSGGAIAIEGPPGIGKTALLESATENQNSDYTFVLQHPSGETVHLSSGNGGSGPGYGSGGCASTATFDDESNVAIESTEGIDTLLSGTYEPEELDTNTQQGGLDKLDGKKLNGKWKLIFLSTENTGFGQLECFELDRGSDPISGRLVAADGAEEEFEGLLALAAAIERAVTEVEEVR